MKKQLWGWLDLLHPKWGPHHSSLRNPAASDQAQGRHPRGFSLTKWLAHLWKDPLPKWPPYLRAPGRLWRRLLMRTAAREESSPQWKALPGSSSSISLMVKLVTFIFLLVIFLNYWFAFLVSTFAKARQALHTAAPATIFCRDKELATIASFLQPSIDERRPGSMYISGRPGTGKTACITYTLNTKKVKENYYFKKSISRQKTNYIVSTVYRQIQVNFHQLYAPAVTNSHLPTNCPAAWPQMGWPPQRCPGILGGQVDRIWSYDVSWRRNIFILVISKVYIFLFPASVLVLDEIDQMSTRDQTVLYTLFELPALTDSRLILIGLANALDLTDRALIRLQSRVQFKPVLLNFPPYSKQDIATILSQRIREAVSDQVGDVIAPSALQYLGGKISSSSGDLRKAIDVCRRAVELAETTAKKQMVLAPSGESQNAASKCVGIPLLCKMMASVESNRFCAGDNTEDADETPLQQKLIIATLLVVVKLGKSKQVTLGKLHTSYGKVCAKYGVTAMDFDEFANTCSLVESRGIVTLKQKNNARLTPICLRLDEREMESTLKDKTLLSSILAQGSLFI